jgi:hypothetical protein
MQFEQLRFLWALASFGTCNRTFACILQELTLAIRTRLQSEQPTEASESPWSKPRPLLVENNPVDSDSNTLSDDTNESPFQAVLKCTEDNQHEMLGPLTLLTTLWSDDNCRMLQKFPVISKAIFLMYFQALEHRPSVRYLCPVTTGEVSVPS